MNTSRERWVSVSDNPNDPRVIARRQALTKSARRPPVARRVEFLRNLAVGKRVLDVGAVEHRSASAESPAWLHRQLVEVASYCLGIDTHEEGARALQRQGYNILVADITSDAIDGPFDVIVAGEVVEHLGRPQDLFGAAASLLSQGGTLVLTTPHPFAFHRVLQGWRAGGRESADHVAMFAPTHVAELAERAGMDLVNWRGVRLKRLRGWRGRLQAAARSILIAVFPESDLDCDTIIYECARAT